MTEEQPQWSHQQVRTTSQRTEKLSYREVYLYCAHCMSEASAAPGDYWDWPDDQMMECCGEPSALCKRGGRFEGDTVVKESVTVGDIRRLVKGMVTAHVERKGEARD